MKKYKVYIKKTSVQYYYVSANSPKEARQIVETGEAGVRSKEQVEESELIRVAEDKEDK